MPTRRVKTFLMQLVEHNYPGKTIEQIMIDAYREHGTERAAAAALGITQQSFNAWKFRLGLEDKLLNPESQRETQDE
ncbi:MAG: hypothetical protein K8L97_08415 [Anaerolineae bacterium]|nr:hypothetical protein [Anaerolineae bacterium]